MLLVLADCSDAEALQRYEDACQAAGETDILPFRLQYSDMRAFLCAQTDWHNGKHLSDGIVPSSLYVVKKDGEIIATLILRHELNAYLQSYIGHIGYRVHPAYRRQGIAGEMLKHAVAIAKREYGLQSVMVSCRRDNIASKKTIQHAGGIWERSYCIPETNKCYAIPEGHDIPNGHDIANRYDIFWIGGK